MNSQTVWHAGPPPHVGWWNASMNKDELCWRWWDGAQWSIPAWPNTHMTCVVEAARTPSLFQGEMQWTHDYPANARVPRVAPIHTQGE